MGEEDYTKVTDGVRTRTKTRGIARPGVKRLMLPLVERHSAVYNYDFSSEENLITLASSHWTISAMPRSTASLYSQDSFYIPSPLPPVFSEEKVDQRRFCIAMTPAQEGPWTRQQYREELGLQSNGRGVGDATFWMRIATDVVGENPFSPDGKDEEGQKDTEEQATVIEDFRNDTDRMFQLTSCDTSTKNLEAALSLKDQSLSVPDIIAEDMPVISKESAHSSVKRKSSTSSSKGIIGKMFSRRFSSSNSRRAGFSDELEERQPLILPNSPPQILVALPSPSLKFPSPTKAESIAVTEEDLRAFVLEKRTAGLPPRTRATLPSKWKPVRPPSPIPAIALSKRGRHKWKAMSLPYVRIDDGSTSAPGLAAVAVASPPPPLPSGARIALSAARQQMKPKPESPTIKKPSRNSMTSVTTPVRSAYDVTSPDSDRDVSRWSDVRKRLKARALKSAMYAVHDGGMISPSGF